MTDNTPLCDTPGLTHSGLTGNSAALLVDPLDLQHIVGVEEITSPDGTPAIATRVSFDGGASWRESWPLPSVAGSAGLVRPALAIDAHGTVNLAALALKRSRQETCLSIYRSPDGGIQWNSPIVLLDGTAECSYSIAADLRPDSPFRGCVYIAADMNNTLCFARSSDGVHWNGQGRSTPGPLGNGFCFNPEVLAGPGGAVHLVWMTGPSACRILAAISLDGGQTFDMPVTVAEGIVSVQDPMSSTAPVTCVAEDRVALCVWADSREGRGRIYYRRSGDCGRTWQGPPEGAPLMPGSESSQHEFQPHLIQTAGGELLCAFYEYGPKVPGGEPLVDLAMAVSYDRGATFKDRMVLSERPWNPMVDDPLSPGATRGALSWLAIN